MAFLNDIIQYTVNIFFSGRSETRIFVLIAYFLAVLITMYLYRNLLSNFIEKNKFKIFKIFLVLSVSLYTIGLACHILIIDRVEIQSTEPIYFFENKEITSERLIHSQLLKSSIGIVLQKFGIEYLPTVDLGFPIISLFPAWFLFLIFGCLIFLGIISLLISCYLTIDTKPQHRPLILFSISVTMVALLLGVIDGGLLHEKIILYIGILVSFIYFKSQREAVILISLLLQTAVAISLLIYGNIEFPHLQLYIFKALVIAFIFITVAYNLRETRRMATSILLIIFSTMLAIASILIDFSLSDYLNTKIDKEYPAILVTDIEQESAGEVIDEVGDLKIYKNYSETTVREIINNYDFIPSIYPVAVEWRNCIPTSYNIYTFNIVSKMELEDKFLYTSKLISLEMSHAVSINPNYYNYVVRAMMPACTPRVLNILGAIIQSSGISSFIIYNIEKQ